MIRLTYAHRWTTLVDALAEHLTEVRATLGPLVPIDIIVSHGLASAYLKLALADRLGIAGNLRFSFLRPYLSEAFEGDRRIISPERLEHLLLATLDSELTDPDMAPVRQYLDAEGPPARRLAQLAQTLRRIYDDYALTRPDMLTQWTAAPSTQQSDATGRPPGTNAWQGALWRRLRTQAAELDGPPLATLDEALVGPADVPEALFVFDVVLGAPVLQKALATWAPHSRIELYATNPCMEFWEDLPAGGRYARDLRTRLLPRAHRDGSEEGDSFTAGDPVPLLLWGRPGRDNVRQLNALTDCDFDGRFEVVDEPPTTLGRLQQDILHRSAPGADPKPADDSVRFIACPGARREAEVIIEAIWSTVADAPPEAPVSFGDIGIVLGTREADAYRSHLAAVFEEYHQVPHHFVDVPIAAKSRVVEAIELLLALPTSRFTRQDLLRLLTHPTVLPNDDRATADEWVGWCQDLAIMHGADHEDHAQTYIEADLLNWDQGLIRLTTGLFLAAEDEHGPVFYPSGDRRYLPHPVPFDRADSAAQLVTLARSLIEDARFMAEARLSMADWAALLRLTFTAYVTPRDDADERDLLRVLRVLERLEDDDLTQHRFDFPVVQALLTAALDDLTENVGQPLADGVIVAPLAMVAHLPLKVVFMPGLHEGAFPVRDPQSGLDVRRADQRPGEVSPRERDQYHFLSRLMATESQVVLSYVARDPGTGETRAPAPTLVELMQILTPYVDGPVEEALVQRPKLRRYSEPPTPYASFAAHREAHTRTVREDLTARVGTVDPAVLRQVLGEEGWQRLCDDLGLHRPPARPVVLPDTVTLRALRLFLDDPLQGWVHHTLGLRRQDEAEDQLAVVDERFRTDALQTTVLLRQVMLEAVRTERTPEAVYHEHADRLEVLGIVPTGVFKRADQRRHLQILEAWTRGLRKVFANRPRPFDPYRFGRGGAVSGAARVVPAVQVSLPTGIVELRGTTQPALDSPPASVILRTGARPAGGPPTHELPAFIDQVARSASGALSEEPYRVWTVYGDGHAVRTESAPFAPAEALAYLTDLVRDLREQPHDYLLPFAAVHRAYRQGGFTPDWAPALATVAASAFGPLAGVRAAPPSADRAQQILTDRFAPFYRRRKEAGE